MPGIKPTIIFGIIELIQFDYIQQICDKTLEDYLHRGKGASLYSRVHEQARKILWKYKRVTTPITQLAKKYGLSDNGLRKRLDKLGVEFRFGRGYWSKRRDTTTRTRTETRP